MRELYNEKLIFFCEIAAFESAIKGQIVVTINPIYLKELKNSTIETIQDTISHLNTSFPAIRTSSISPITRIKRKSAKICVQQK